MPPHNSVQYVGDTGSTSLAPLLPGRTEHFQANEQVNAFVFSDCPSCRGKGRIKCDTCEGVGMMYAGPFGKVRWITCPDCGGAIDGICPECRGSGRSFF